MVNMEHKKLNMDDLFERLDTLAEQIGTAELLENLALALSRDELQDCLEYIDRMHDTNIFNELEE